MRPTPRLLPCSFACKIIRASIVARIELDDGTSAGTYFLTPDQVEGRLIIASGSWRSRRKETAV